MEPQLVDRPTTAPILTEPAVVTPEQQRIADLEQKLAIAEQKISELEAKLAIAEELAGEDELTGLPNLRYMSESLTQELGNVSRQKAELCVVYLDLDHFKQVNDTYGHDQGDRVLKEFAQVMQEKKRASDVFGRIGGEEFMLLLPMNPASGPVVINEILERYLEATKTINRSPNPGKVEPQTVSIGCVLVPSGTQTESNTVQKIKKQADHALYLSKEAGRNRFTFTSLEEESPEPLSIPRQPLEAPTFMS